MNAAAPLFNHPTPKGRKEILLLSCVKHVRFAPARSPNCWFFVEISACRAPVQPAWCEPYHNHSNVSWISQTLGSWWIYFCGACLCVWVGYGLENRNITSTVKVDQENWFSSEKCILCTKEINEQNGQNSTNVEMFFWSSTLIKKCYLFIYLFTGIHVSLFCFVFFCCCFSMGAFPSPQSSCMWFVVGLKSCLSEPISAGCVAKNSPPCLLHAAEWAVRNSPRKWNVTHISACSVLCSDRT